MLLFLHISTTHAMFMYKKSKKTAFYAYYFQIIAYFCAILRIIIQDEEESKPVRCHKNDYLQ